MKKYLSIGVVTLTVSCPIFASDGLVKIASDYSVKETANRFESIAKQKGITVFARVDHQQNAQSVGLILPPTEVIIFGNPKVGTPLMQCSQNIAIDLPQKMLVSEDANQAVWVSYNAPRYLAERHEMKGCDKAIDKVAGILNKLVIAAAKK